jgi:hypothetical protein
MEPVVKLEGFEMNELHALGNSLGGETDGLGVSMKTIMSLLVEAMGEKVVSSLNEGGVVLRCHLKHGLKQGNF